MNGLGLRHIHARKRLAQGLEPFPSRNVARRAFDYLMFAVGVVQPAALLPQIKTIYIDHSTAGVSIATWLMLTVFNTLWAFYGFVHRDKLITTANVLLTILDVAIVFGALSY